MAEKHTEMVERVAEAILAASPHDDHNFDPAKVARAAIRAMLEPTDSMTDAAAAEWPSDEPHGMHEAIYQAMIRSALGEK